jgi:hypothetical protein
MTDREAACEGEAERGAARSRRRDGAGEAALTVEVVGALGTLWLEVDDQGRLIGVEVVGTGRRGCAARNRGSAERV